MEWISVEDELPENESLVIIWNIFWPTTFLFAMYEYKVFMLVNPTERLSNRILDFPVAPTHWLAFPMPTPIINPS